jgi:antitoxin HicB
MALASWHAVMPPNGKRLVGDRNRPAKQAHSASLDWLLFGASGGPARIHQENSRNVRGRFSAGTKAAKGAGEMSRKNLGSSIDDFLRGDKIFEEAQAQAIKEVVSWQLAKAMKKRKISKARMAALLKTSRSQVDRILDPKCDITLSSLQRAAALVGQKVVIELV